MIPTNDDEKLIPPTIHQLTDQIKLLVHVCRLIAHRATNREVADELLDLATALDSEVEKIRAEVTRLLGN